MIRHPRILAVGANDGPSATPRLRAARKTIVAKLADEESAIAPGDGSKQRQW
jgi:hypothetical protein